MSELYVVYETFETGEDNRNVDYTGSWYSESQHDFKKLSLSEGEQKITVKGNPKVNSFHWLVYVLYSESDSFGIASGCLEIIGAYDSEAKAQYIKKFIEDDYEDYENRKPSNEIIHDADGLPVNTNTWKGYFEELESVNVEKLRIEK